ncbi:MAG: ABC transporter ATP-binding protein [Lactobacillus iners]|nr:ABC transporter ATP-binding protein [Lactobacillus iners]
MKISVNNLAIKYQDHYGIKNISCELTAGKFVALVGHNGSGKTTLCNALVGLLEPSEGDINIQDLSTDKQNFSTIGFAPQSQVVDWYSNVEANIMLGAQLAHLKPNEAKNQLDLILRLLDLSDLRDRSLTDLSGGQLQRVQIARAIVHNPLIYILDEPTVGLDAQNTDNLMKYLVKEAQSGKLVIVSSHDLFLLQEYAEDLLLLDEGKLIYHGSINDLLKDRGNSRKFIITLDNEYSVADDFMIKNDDVIKVEHESDNTWQLEVKPEVTISDLMLMFKKKIKVTSCVEHEKTLKEVYLSMSKRSGNYETN